MSYLLIDIGTYGREVHDVLREVEKFSREPIAYPVNTKDDETIVSVDNLRSVVGIIAERARTTPTIVTEILERMSRARVRES